MPKPMFGDNGSGMHAICRCLKAVRTCSLVIKYGGLSEMALFYIGGIAKHATKAINARRTQPPTPTSVWCRVMKRR
ncbi:hypothetical protein WDV93_19035 [Pantoea ananatis]